MKHTHVILLSFVVPAVWLGGAASAQLATVYPSCPASRSNPYPVGTNQGTLATDQNGNLCAVTQGTLSGSVTANAGTNLNTSALALETGNLATIAGAVSSGVTQGNLKQVNGITTSTGTGAVGTGTQRVAVGTDTATVAGTAPVTGGVPVVNGGSTYNTVAASQTAQALTGGGGGATGDYLSQCTVVPATTSPGVVTILDNATTVYAFPGGASSLSNLVPFTIPVGAVSVSGAWKITTGANVSVVCVGKFH